MNLKDRPTLQKVLAAFVTSTVLLAGILLLGGDEERDAEIVERVCAAGLSQVAEIGGVDLCSHGPDPRRAFPVTAPAQQQINVNEGYRQRDLCPGDARVGNRIHVFIGAPSDRAPIDAEDEALVRMTLGYAERMLRNSGTTHVQKLKFYCADDKVPTLTKVTFPAVGSDGEFTFEDAFTGVRQAGGARSGILSLAFPMNLSNSDYPYCGEGTVMTSSDPSPPSQELLYPYLALVSPFCLGASDTTLHELGHNMGAVHPDAPNDSGAWHCFDVADVMCYDDGGSYFRNGGRMVTRCQPSVHNGVQLPLFDCNRDDYYSATRASTGYLATHFNLRNSPFLTRPRRR